MRLRAIQLMQIKYEARMLPVPSANTALSATAEPMLIRARRTQMTSETRIALIGMLHRGET